ncbi:hypothetical protein N0V90_012210 [Kalmusia sp. IMI 367209]|nr:hypothetical protein N0V90_012210 [Kalmusia sp. IMI 367209]
MVSIVVDFGGQLRAAYVAHTVSKLVTYRVFGPFLFSLGRRYDKADSLFLSMSNHIRDKSTRKEAIWRQQTLLAAFTSSGAKQRINTAAGTVVEEIVNAIKHFADPKEEEGIKIAVKRIVKLAAETWRFARLEREMISATMPAVHDEEHEFIGPEFWPSHNPEGTPIPSLVGTTAPSDEKPKLLLRLFPVIYREPKHENFRDSENEKPDEGCIYHYGLALYDDAEPVVQRAEELKAAGLPPTTAASPTAADFPPPLLPAPRTSLPPTPILEKASVRSKSPPPEFTKDVDRVSVRPTSPTSIKSGKTSIRSRTPPPSALRLHHPLFHTQTQPSPPSSPKPTPSEFSQTPYTRPAPGPIDFDTPIDAPPLPEPTEVGTVAHSEAEPSASADAPPLPAPTESILAPSASLAVLAAEYEDTPAPPPPAPTESAIIPPFDPSASNLPTPPHSRAVTPSRPVSPLFAAIDEIDALSSHRSRRTSSSRRSARSRPSDEELHASTKDAPKDPSSKSTPQDKDKDKERPDTARRTSGYSLSTRSSRETASDRTESTERPSTGRSSRYLCESRSAAIKGLYPNSPLAGQSPQLSRTSSLRSQKRKSVEAGTWDTTTATQTQTGVEAPAEEAAVGKE